MMSHVITTSSGQTAGYVAMLNGIPRTLDGKTMDTEILVYFKVPSQYFPGRAEESHRNLNQNSLPNKKPAYEAGVLLI
jgi:hypothetical protein